MHATDLSPEVWAVTEKLAELHRPKVIYLYNHRVNAMGQTTGFKLCVVAPFEDKHAAEQRSYMEIDSEIPFDLLLYTPDEWEEITGREGSFAEKIERTGTIVYGC